jgi:hypothetical protein
VAEGSRNLRGNHLEPEDVEVDLIAFEKPACPLIFIVCYLNISKFQEGPKRFERSKAVERLERLERTDPRDERSEAVERLERLEPAAV